MSCCSSRVGVDHAALIMLPRLGTAWLLLETVAIAGLSGVHPYSWTEVSNNQRYVFAGVSSLSTDDQIAIAVENNRFDSAADRQRFERAIREIHDWYPVSGMYLNDGSRTPIWTLDKWEDNGIPTSDGQQLIVLGEAAYGNDTTTDVVRVYNRNGLVREVTMHEVVPVWQQIARNWAGGSWAICTNVGLNEFGDRIVIETDSGDVLELSLNDVQAVSTNVERNTLHVVAASWRGIALILLVLAVFFLVLSIVCGLLKKVAVRVLNSLRPGR